MLKRKFCKGCQEELCISLFNRTKNVKDGYENKCKECRNNQRKKFHTYSCKNCGRDFSKIVKQTFCSNKCSGEFKRRCGRDFERFVNSVDGYKLISKYNLSNEKVSILHKSCGNEFEITPNSFEFHGSRCSHCFRNDTKTSDVFTNEVYRLVGNEYVVQGEYVNSKTKLKMKHVTCGFAYYVEPGKFLAGRRCPDCKHSKGELEIKKYLDDRDFSYRREFIIPDCRDIMPLPFDFAIIDDGDVIALIEYDGEQHFHPIEHWGGKIEFEKVKRRDGIKNLFASQNDIPLIRIPYFKFDKITHILDESLDTIYGNTEPSLTEMLGRCND